MSSLQQRLYDAWLASGMTLDDLADRAGINISRGAMSRKLRGLTALRSDELEAFAGALGVRIAFGKGRAA